MEEKFNALYAKEAEWINVSAQANSVRKIRDERAKELEKLRNIEDMEAVK